MWMRLDTLHFSGQAFGHSWPVVDFPFRINEGDVGVWIDDARHAKILVDALAAPLVLGLHPTGDFKTVLFQRPVFFFPEFSPFIGLGCLVLTRVQTNVNDGCRCFRGDFRTYVRFLPGRQLAVHDHAGDTDTLLAARLTDGVKTGTKEQLSEDFLDASFWNAWSVVLCLKLNDVLLVVDFGDLDFDFRQNTSFFACVERIVNGFFDGGDE